MRRFGADVMAVAAILGGATVAFGATALLADARESGAETAHQLRDAEVRVRDAEVREVRVQVRRAQAQAERARERAEVARERAREARDRARIVRARIRQAARDQAVETDVDVDSDFDFQFDFEDLDIPLRGLDAEISREVEQRLEEEMRRLEDMLARVDLERRRR